MQGPGQQPPRRRAGDSSGMPGSPDGLKDWQKNTWYGPAPANSNPFEEPDDAPELLEQRSRNVSDHTGEFWSDATQSTGYQYTRNDLKKASGKDAGRMPGEKRREHVISLRAVLILAGLLVAAVMIMYFGVFRVREIRVVGNSAISAADVIRLSGIRKGDSILRLSEEETERHLIAAASSEAAAKGNYNFYRLQFRYLEKEMPGTVTIAVREREACCFLTWCGILYVMDKTGMVLYETEDASMRDRMQLVEVKGLDIRAGAHVGQTMVLSSAAQELVFRDLFMEMKVLGCTDQIREVDLSNPSSLLMSTWDGYTVSMGNGESIHAKLRSLLLVRQKLIEMEQTGGTISVSNPGTPSYSPAAVP